MNLLKFIMPKELMLIIKLYLNLDRNNIILILILHLKVCMNVVYL